MIILPLNSFSAETVSEEIQIFYLERPPYYYSENNEFKGVLADLTKEIFKKAGISYSWLSLPPQRLISMFENTDEKICSPGWFLKTDRMRYANFTHPIYRNNPLVVLILKDNKDAFNGIDTLASLFKDRSLTLGTVATYRYSGYIDNLINQHKPDQIKVYSSAVSLVEMMAVKRVSYMLISPVEVDFLIQKAGLDRNLFDLLTFPDIPAGNKRYLMCSKSVDNSTLEKLNDAIEEIVDPALLSE